MFASFRVDFHAIREWINVIGTDAFRESVNTVGSYSTKCAPYVLHAMPLRLTFFMPYARFLRPELLASRTGKTLPTHAL